MGRHYRNSDTSDLPFSYLIEHEDESILAPGVNLRSVGTVRDARKWPKRDRRKDPRKLDRINFKLLSPYTVGKMLNGSRLLAELKGTSGKDTEYFTYHNVRITRSSLERGIKLYEIGINKFLGNCLIKRLEGKRLSGVEQLRAELLPETSIGVGKWVDLAGMLAPEDAVEKMLSDIEDGAINTLQEVTEAFDSMQKSYEDYEWAWAADVLVRRLGRTIEQVSAADIIELTSTWKEVVVELDNTLYTDARKEFDDTVQIGYGPDGDEETRRRDFAAVRGTFEKDGFVLEIKKHIAAKTALGDELIERIKQVR